MNQHKFSRALQLYTSNLVLISLLIQRTRLAFCTFNFGSIIVSFGALSATTKYIAAGAELEAEVGA